jgi:hypothetical protein
MDANLGFFQRLVLAFVAFFYVLANRDFAGRVAELRDRQRGALPPPTDAGAAAAAPPAPAPAERAAAPPPASRQVVPLAPERPEGQEALHLLALLQRDGRLVDFVAEDLTGVPDDQLAAGARVVHEGCRKALDTYVKLEPVLPEAEGASVQVPAGFDPAAIRLGGNVVGAPPFRGTVRHHGWRAAEVRIPPPPPGDPRVIAPAEVDL